MVQQSPQAFGQVAQILICSMLLFFSTLVSSASFPTGFEAGWNGLAKQPPMAWRTYNAQYDFLTFPPSAATFNSAFFFFPLTKPVSSLRPRLYFLYRYLGMPMDQSVMEASIDALLSSARSVDGYPRSLYDVGM